ncbi:MAG: hypothetical protein P4L59_09830 [Desulfosporosinus sp.]|nr:hypothetical protein [Desulfosporosinus sp.]
MLEIIKSFVAPAALTTVEAVLALVLADFIFGILVSLRAGTFSASKLPQFIQTSLLPYSGGLLVLALFSNANTELGGLFFTTAATVTVKFVADIVTKATQLFSGVQIVSPITVATVTPIPAGATDTPAPATTTEPAPQPAPSPAPAQ